MPLLALEHSPIAYRADFAFYGAASTTMALLLLLYSPAGSGLALGLWALAGAASWTLVEYLLHRFVLHGLPPFNRWHAEHHRRPTALIASPTLLSATLFIALGALPAWWLLGAWSSCAMSFGMVTGYLAYGLTHHATHHAASCGLLPVLRDSAWLTRRKRWHARHHATQTDKRSAPRNYGVSSGLWDSAFGTAGALPARATES